MFVVASLKMLPHGPVFRILKTMDVDLTTDQKAFARRASENALNFSSP